MTVRTKTELKALCNDGDLLTEPEYVDLIDSMLVGVSQPPNDVTKFLRGDGTWEESSTAWTDYSNISTIVGWSSFTTKKIFYKRVGKIVFVTYRLEGTSNSTSTSFTLPYNNNNNIDLYDLIYGADNGTQLVALLGLYSGANTASFYSTLIGGVWTASGTKAVRGQFWYQTS